jgi:exopolysaccharide production protein ExoQ
MSSSLCKPENECLKAIPTSGMPFSVGFYFALRVFIVPLSVRILGTDPQTGAAINLVLNFFLLIVAAFFSLGEVRHSFARMARMPDVACALFFLVFSGCSLSWSSAASLPAAIAYWCAMAADMGIVILMLRARPFAGVARSLMKGYVWGACVAAAIAWMMPVQSDLRLGDEELLGPNQIGYLCAFAFFFAQYLILQKDGKWGVGAFLLAVTVLRSLSKTTIVAFLVGEAFLLIRDRSFTRRTRISLAIASGLVVAVFWGLLASYYDVYINTGNQSETLSGRIGIWAYFLQEAVQQPWIGHGFHSVWKVVPPFAPDQFEARHAHNEVMQQFYAYGFVGICMFAGIYLSVYRHMRRLAAGRLKTLLFAFLLFVLVRGLTDTEAFDLSLPLWAIVMISLLVEDARTATREEADRSSNKPLIGSLSCLSWKWRKRSSVKITERTREEATETLHAGREGRHSQEAFGGRSADLGSV